MTEKIHWVISNYNQDPTVIIKELDGSYEVYNQGETHFFPQELTEKCFHQTKHSGHNISDYFKFIIDHYNDLPEVSGFIKGNLFPRHITKELFLSRKKIEGMVPFYGESKSYKAQKHRLNPFKFVAQQIAPGVYLEITNDWYCKCRPKGKYYPTLNSYFEAFFSREVPNYITFTPGACMKVPKENILRWSCDTYKKLYEVVTYEHFPVEAFHAERCMLYLFMYPLE